MVRNHRDKINTQISFDIENCKILQVCRRIKKCTCQFSMCYPQLTKATIKAIGRGASVHNIQLNTLAESNAHRGHLENYTNEEVSRSKVPAVNENQVSYQL